jgi:hypothetical protein
MRLIIAFLLLLAPLRADDLLPWLDQHAQRHLKQRVEAVNGLKTRAGAENRQKHIRETLLRLMGGIPEYKGKLRSAVTGTLKQPGYRIEKLWFESAPGYPVTANLYVPDKPGRHPGILYSMGHWDLAKAVAYSIAGNLALKGFVVLVYDPVGQGERLQAFEPRIGASLRGGATAQHMQDGARVILNGTALIRWFIMDSRAALDYLISRPEVDATRLGASGCSGGGTQTAFFAAVEPRLRAAAPACYITSFHELFTGSVGDSEQSAPGFIAAGLDQADLIASFAPRPYLVINTEEDFFPIAGSRRAVADARKVYELFDASSQLEHSIGPGGHGTPLVTREALYAFFLKHLGDPAASSKEHDIAPLAPVDLRVTATGQVSTSLKARELSELIAEQTRFAGAATPEVVRERLREWTREPEPVLAPSLQYLAPTGGTKQEAAFLVVQPSKPDEPIVALLRERGYSVMLVRPRGTPVANANDLNADWLNVTRAALVGMSLNGLRVRDILAGVDELASKHGAKTIHGYGRRAAGIWLLGAAALDERLRGVWVHDAPASWREGFTAPVHRGLHEIVFPAAALHFDIADMVRTIGPGRVYFTDPVNAMRLAVPRDGDYVFRPYDSPDADYLARFLERVR